MEHIAIIIKTKYAALCFGKLNKLLFFSLPLSLLPFFASFLQFLISDRDRDPQCNLHCSRSQSKPLCASDGRTYESMCDYQRAKCREASLSVTHRGRCKGRWISNTFEWRSGSPTDYQTSFFCLVPCSVSSDLNCALIWVWYLSLGCRWQEQEPTELWMKESEGAREARKKEKGPNVCLWSRRGWLYRNAQSNPEGDLPCCLYQWETEIPLSGRNVQQGRTCRHIRWVCLKKDQPAFLCWAQNACKSLYGLYFASLLLHIYLEVRILSFSQFIFSSVYPKVEVASFLF